MERVIHTTYRYRLQPTAAQETHLMQFAGARRWVWNWALGKRIAHYEATNQHLRTADLEAELVRLKQQPETAWLCEMESQSLQQALRDLDAAYTHCLHKLSHRLVRDYDLITIEDLSVQGLARTKLALSVLDAGWGMFRSFLTYKADRAGVHLVLVDRFFPSSKTCSACGERNDRLTRSDRIWMCATCATTHDRDLNAAINLDREGRRLLESHVAAGLAETQNACREPVSPIVTGRRRSLKQEALSR